MSSKPNRPSVWLLFPSKKNANMPPKYKGKPSRDISCPMVGSQKSVVEKSPFQVLLLVVIK